MREGQTTLRQLRCCSWWVCWPSSCAIGLAVPEPYPPSAPSKRPSRGILNERAGSSCFWREEGVGG
jgi:hypothetical protein